MAKRRLIFFAPVVLLGGGIMLGQMLLVPPPTLVPPSALTTSEVPASNAAGTPMHRIAWNGAGWYLQGANVPWYNWGCDFGCNVTNGKTGGVSA